MSYVHPAWGVLGIEPTEDKRAIKRAYAAKLKATDVEADPQAFIMLRQALEDANWDSDYLPYREDQEVEVALLDPEPEPTADALAPISDEEIEPPTAVSLYKAEDDWISVDIDEDDDPATWRWEPERQPATEAAQERIVQLLWGDAPIAEIEVELVELTHTILTAPEMENIDHASGVEDWMASIIAQSIPRSDAMARVAVPHFGWADQVDNWRTRYGVAQAAARLSDIEALDRLERSEHRWHQAWTLLKQPPPDAVGWKRVAKHREAIIALMASIRHHNPALEAELNVDHVAQWEPAIAGGQQVEAKTGGFSWWWLFWAVFVFAQLARLAG